MLVYTALGLLIAIAIFMHGQLAEGTWYVTATRIICIITITVIITLTFANLFPFLPIWKSLIVAASTAWAACWGPEIGWDASVRRTQFYKGLWLAAGMFPLGLAYAALRPLAYWVGYTRFPGDSNKMDEISRGLSGISLGIIVTVSLFMGDIWSL